MINPSAPDIETIVSVCILRPGGGETVILDDDEMIAYIRDPDGWAANYYGLSKVDYIEWTTLDGAAMCRGRTANGDPCRNLTGGSQLEASDWKAAHRKKACKIHSRQPAKDPAR